MFNPYVLLGALAGAILIATASFGAGWKASSNSWKADMLAAEQAHADQLRAEIDRSNIIAAALESEKGKSRVVYKTITKRVDKIIDRPVYLNQCFDADGLRLANSAIAGQAPDPGESPSTLPKPTPLRGRDGS
jgi:hypothetical protein